VQESLIKGPLLTVLVVFMFSKFVALDRDHGPEGGDFRAPLGRAVIGGVMTSTLLTLLAIPTFYDILADWRGRVRNRLAARGEAPAHLPSRPRPAARATGHGVPHVDR
jgi:hypothetical protein